jgi:rare lipoprotein A
MIYRLDRRELGRRVPRAMRIGFALLCSCASTSNAPAHTATHPAHPAGSIQQLGARAGEIDHGWASWYGKEQQGGPTASGERFDLHQLTAAHRTLPLGSIVRVTNTRNGKSVEVRINDRGPYGNHGRIIDLSQAAAQRLDFIDAGTAPITLEVIRLGHRE